MQAAAPIIENPFAVLTAIAAPAVLTNAASILCLGTGNRIARIMDRTRILAAELGTLDISGSEYRIRVTQLERLQIRSFLLFRALRNLYAALGLFASAALISVLGSVFAFYRQQFAFRAAAVAGLTVGTLAITGLVWGCVLMVRETRLALQNISEEAELARNRYRA